MFEGFDSELDLLERIEKFIPGLEPGVSSLILTRANHIKSLSKAIAEYFDIVAGLDFECIGCDECEGEEDGEQPE
jgi:hypothetical protein